MTPAEALVLGAVQLLTQAAALGHSGALAALDTLADPATAPANRRAMSNAERQKRYRTRNAARNETVTPTVTENVTQNVTRTSFSSSSDSAEKEQNLSEGLNKAPAELALEPVTEIVTRNVTRNADRNEIVTANSNACAARQLRSASQRDAVSAVFGHWLTVMAKDPGRWRLTPERRRKIEGRLKDGYAVADLKAAIDGCAKSPFHMGENDSGSLYNDLELICRNGTHVEKFIQLAVAPPPRKAADGPRGAAYQVLTPPREELG